jgi:hypothetical protein
VKTLSGSRPDPIGSVYFPSVPRARPGTSDVASGCRIHVVQPSRLLPFQSDVQPLWAPVVIVALKAQTAVRRIRGTDFIVTSFSEPAFALRASAKQALSISVVVSIRP